LGPAVLGTALAALRLQYLDLTGAGLDTGFNTDPQAQFLTVRAAVLTDRRRQAPYQRVVRVHVEAQPAGLQLTEGSGLPGDRHTVAVEELTHPRPHGRGAMLGQQPAFTAVLLHRIFAVLGTCCPRLRPRIAVLGTCCQPLRARHLVLACAAGADFAGYRQQIADGLALQLRRYCHARFDGGGLVVRPPITEVAIFTEQIAAAAQSYANHHQSQ